MEILLNGAPYTLPQSCTVAQLIELLGYVGKRVAVERNGDIIARSTYPETYLASNDRLEIVAAVGGG